MKRFLSQCGRRIELALRLLDDDFQLARQLVTVDQGVLQGIGLDVDRGGESRGGQRDQVAGVIVAGGRIEIASRRLGLPGNHPDATARSAFEKHVFEHVRYAHPTVGFVEETRLHVGDHRCHLGGPFRLNQESQSVGQHLPADTFNPGGRWSMGSRVHEGK